MNDDPSNGILESSKSFRWTDSTTEIGPARLHPLFIALSFGFAIGLFALSQRGFAQLAQETNQAPDELHAHIRRLVEQLSDPNYSSRLSAQSELERIGVLALDQLHAASFHPDPQIASTARFVVQSNQFSWSWDTDPVSVRQILKNYGAADSEKSMYIDQLQRLDHDEGFPALCRLVRYETRSGLAKRAALILMRSKPTVGQTSESRKEAIRSYIEGGQSQASRWLIQYASTNGKLDLKWWEQTLADELGLLKSSSVETNVDLVLELHKWVVEQLTEHPESRPKALAIGRSILNIGKSVPTLDSMVGHRSTRANEFAQWALKYRLPELVQDQHAKLPTSILSREFFFGYLLAESFKLQSRDEQANAIASHSLNQIACNERGEPMDPNAVDELNKLRAIDFSANRQLSGQDRRCNLAQKLESRGQFAWAEAEFRLVLNDDLTNFTTLEGMKDLAAMLQTQGKHGDAAMVLEPFVKRYESEPMFKRQMDEMKSITGDILSGYYLYCGDRDRENNQSEQAAKNYWLSIERLPDREDSIIGLFRLALPESDREKLREKLTKIIADGRARIREDEGILKGSTPSDHASYSYRLAAHCNNLAWLVVNTEGNKEEALFLSRKACLLTPETPEYLDTLAYCFAALDRVDEAIEQQKLAVELKPHHPEFTKALKRFEAIRDEAKSHK
jgi:tetratricopeptide (TPR) repeat protein